MYLLFAVLGSGLGLVQALERTVMTLVKAPKNNVNCLRHIKERTTKYTGEK